MLPETRRPISAPVSVVATVRNEAGSIGDLLDGLLDGHRAPDEIVIADAGSTDGTRELLEAASRRSSVVRVVDVPGNRSRGRNAAIEAASHDVIACIDGGCRPRPDWLAHLTAPFETGAAWVGGFYLPVGSVKQRSIGATMVFVLEEAKGGGFLPSARSMAFTRPVWASVGGFPEHLEVSEDTAFDESLAAAGVPLVFAPDAIVEWDPPATFRQQCRVVFMWSASDGAAGIGSFGYRRQAVRVATSAVAVPVLGWIDPRLALVGLLPVASLLWAETRYKYRAVPGLSRFGWIPLAWLVGLTARLAGFTVGRLRRRSVA